MCEFNRTFTITETWILNRETGPFLLSSVTIIF